MASLIGWLAYDGARTSSGVAVASGRAYFYQPGTTATQVAVFSDADGLTAVTQPVALDAGGRAEVYTTTACRIEIQDSTGATVKVSDRGNTVQASQVEIQNAVATGTSLTTGAQVTGGRTDLNTFLSNFADSAGTTDGSVLVGSTARRLRDALQFSSRTFDITAPPYGAAGDGVVDDTSAIQDAITAAAAVNGIVLVKPGTYKLTASLTGCNRILFLGSDPATCIFRMDTNSVETLKSTTGFSARGIKLTTAASGVGDSPVDLTGAGLTAASYFERCTFEQLDLAENVALIAEGRATFVECAFVNTGISVTATGGTVSLFGGTMTSADSAMRLFDSDTNDATYFINGVTITATAASATTCFGLNSPAYILDGCNIQSTGGSTLNIGKGSCVENGCVLDANITFSVACKWSTWREHAYKRTSGSATSYAPDSALAKFHEVVSTGATFEWSTPTNPPGTSTIAHELVLRYKNTSGGNVTPTLAAGYKGAAVLVANNSACGWHFVYDATLTAWVQIGDVVAYAS